MSVTKLHHVGTITQFTNGPSATPVYRRADVDSRITKGPFRPGRLGRGCGPETRGKERVFV